MKRATQQGKRKGTERNISIHALVKRATQSTKLLGSQSGNFNPRPREEGDAAINPDMAGDFDFNPRPREEGDKLSVVTL